MYEDSNETAAALLERLLDAIKNSDISVSSVIAFGADAAFFNFGKHCSVYLKLKEQYPAILKANYHCQVIHDAARHSFK